MKGDLLYRQRPDGLSWEFYIEGGGSIPKMLEGLWTNPQVCQTALNAYRAQWEEKAQLPAAQQRKVDEAKAKAQASA